MTRLSVECERAARIDDRIAASLQIDQGDREFLESHLKYCEKCRVEARAFQALKREDDGEGVADALDDLSRRRLMDQVIAGARSSGASHGLNRSEVGEISRKWLSMGFAVGAAVAAAVYLLVFFSADAPVDRGAAKKEERSQIVPAANGLITLVSGEVLSGGKGAAVGARITSGERIETRDGVAVVDLTDGVVFLLGPDSRIEIGDSSQALEVELATGSLLASVTPGRAPPRFVVATKEGSVVVKGTVFQVVVEESRTEVKVLRGEVELRERSGSRPLAHGNGATLGRETTALLADEEKTELMEQTRLFELLESKESAVLSLSSYPEGAEVTIDGVGFCTTPCSALVRSGDRELEISLEGERKVHELVGMAAGDRISRVFKLDEKERGEAHVEKEGAQKREGAAKELLLGAQSARAKRDFEEAAGLYRKLIDAHPHSNEATISLVSLGEIELEKLGSPAAALKLFKRYLRGKNRGALEPEALFGKARAERALGRLEDEKETLRAIVKRFPSAVQSAEASKRLAELGSD